MRPRPVAEPQSAMGLLGTSASEEAQLREAAQLHRPLVDHSLHTASSAYETAGESLYASATGASAAGADDAASYSTITHDDANKTVINSKDNSVSEFQPKPRKSHDAADDASEDELRRIFTADRAAHHTLVLEEASGASSAQIHVTQLAWDGPDDPANPENWSSFKRWFVTMTISVACLCVSLGLSLFVNGVPKLREEFGVSQELAIVGLTLYLIGLAFGPLFTSPLSEIIGRRWVYLITFPLAMLFTMGVGLSKNMASVLVLRFFAGYVASPVLAVASGTISDIWGANMVALSFAVALFCVFSFLGPVVGPIIGGFVAEKKDWQFLMWVNLMWYGALLPLVFLCPETYKPVILRTRAHKRGIKVIAPPLTWEYAKKVLAFALVKPIEMLLVEPIVTVLLIYIAFIFAVLFGFFEAFPIIFLGVYGFHEGVAGLPFLSVGMGLLLGILCYTLIDYFVVYPTNPDGTRGKRDDEGNLVMEVPESKMFIGKIGAVCLPVSLFWLAWTARADVHWAAPVMAGLPFGFGMILVFLSCVLYFAFCFPPMSVASAMAANSLLRYLLASVFPLFTVQMYERLHVDWATSLFAFISLAMVPLPWIFERYGPRFRERSKYGYHALFKRMAAEKAAAEAAACEKATGASTAEESLGKDVATSV